MGDFKVWSDIISKPKLSDSHMEISRSPLWDADKLQITPCFCANSRSTINVFLRSSVGEIRLYESPIIRHSARLLAL